jgi:hypothetical protein
VQNAFRHSSLRITPETYVHRWPKKDRRRNIVESALRVLRTTTTRRIARFKERKAELPRSAPTAPSAAAVVSPPADLNL